MNYISELTCQLIKRMCHNNQGGTQMVRKPFTRLDVAGKEFGSIKRRKKGMRITIRLRRDKIKSGACSSNNNNKIKMSWGTSSRSAILQDTALAIPSNFSHGTAANSIDTWISLVEPLSWVYRIPSVRVEDH